MPHAPAAFRFPFAVLRLFTAIAVLSSGDLKAEAPVVTTMARRGASPGETLNLAVGGKGLAGEVKLWTSFGPMVPLADTPADNGKNDGSCTFRVEVPKDAALGMHAVRIVSPAGASVLHPFFVDDLPTVEKRPGNQTFAKAQEVTLPAAVDGRVENLSRDYYRFRVQAGQTVSLEAFSRRIGSPLDASLFLYDSKGRILAYSDDAEGLSTDPQLSYTFAVGGDFVVEIRDIRYSGGDGYGYRLRIGDFPCVQTAFPLAARRGVLCRIDFAGISCDDAVPALVTVPSDWKEVWYPVSTRRSSGHASAFATVAVVDQDEIVDREPNNHRPQAQEATLGPGISGRFDAPGDVDQFRFDAKKGERWLFTGLTRELGAPSDLTFRLLNSDGGVVANVDDNGTAEGVLDVTFPADGSYFLELTDLNRRGGPQYSYRVVPERYRPGVMLAADTDVLNVPAGGAAALKITAARRDFTGTIEIALSDLPPGYAAGPVFLGPGMTSAVAVITAPTGAAPSQLSSLKPFGRTPELEGSEPVPVRVTDVVRSRWNGPTQVHPRFTIAIAIAPAPAARLSLRAEPAEVTISPGGKATLKVIASRGEGLDAPIKMTTLPEKEGAPPNVSFELKPIDKGASEVTIVVSASDKAAPGSYSVAFSGVHEKDKATTVAMTNNLTIRVVKP